MPHVPKTWTPSAWLSVAEKLCAQGFVRLRTLPCVLAARTGGESGVALLCVPGAKQDVAGQMLISEGAHGAPSTRCAHI